jgi:hypothetical protein
MPTLVAKMRFKPGRLRLVDVPGEVLLRLRPFPAGIVETGLSDGPCDALLFCARNRASLDGRLAAALDGMLRDGLCWFGYPKLSSALAGDLSREVVWQVVSARGLRPVSQVAMDETWSALRFRPADTEKR